MRPRGWKGLLVAAIAALAVWLWPELGPYLGGPPSPPAGGGSAAAPYELSGRIVSVADGDTVTLRAGGRTHRVRLASIDAPEAGDRDRPGQPYGKAAGRHLRTLAGDAEVSALCHERDQYDRDVCDLTLPDGTSANQRMVADGMAWANRQGGDKYLRDRGLLDLQEAARQARRGLWADRQQPVQPWVWRYRCWQQRQCG